MEPSDSPLQVQWKVLKFKVYDNLLKAFLALEGKHQTLILFYQLQSQQSKNHDENLAHSVSLVNESFYEASKGTFLINILYL